MQSQNRKLKRIISGQQNPGPNSTKLGGKRLQIIVLQEGANLPKKKRLKLEPHEVPSYIRSRNKIFTKRVLHQA